MSWSEAVVGAASCEPPARGATTDRHDRPFPRARQPVEKRHHRLDKRLRLIDIDGVAGGRDHGFSGAGYLRGHVVGSGKERRVIGADHHQRRHLDLGQHLDHLRIALGQHAARGAGEARRVAVAHRRAFAAGGFQHIEALAVEAIGGGARTLVPDLAGVVLLEAGPGIDDEQRADAFGMRAIKCQRHVSAERQPADDRPGRADLVEQRRDVGNRQRLAIGCRIAGVIGLAVAAHVPQDQLMLFRQRLDLPVPHRRCRRIAVGQDQWWATAVDLVIDLDPVAIELRHVGISWPRPGGTLRWLILARSVSRCEMRKTRWGACARATRSMGGHGRLPRRTTQLH